MLIKFKYDLLFQLPDKMQANQLTTRYLKEAMPPAKSTKCSYQTTLETIIHLLNDRQYAAQRRKTKPRFKSIPTSLSNSCNFALRFTSRADLPCFAIKIKSYNIIQNLTSRTKLTQCYIKTGPHDLKLRFTNRNRLGRFSIKINLHKFDTRVYEQKRACLFHAQNGIT